MPQDSSFPNVLAAIARQSHGFDEPARLNIPLAVSSCNVAGIIIGKGFRKCIQRSDGLPGACTRFDFAMFSECLKRYQSDRTALSRFKSSVDVAATIAMTAKPDCRTLHSLGTRRG